MNLLTQSKRIREQYAKSITINGVTYLPSVLAARCVKTNINTLYEAARQVEGINMVLTATNGMQFIRIPRHRGDMRSPLYWKVQS